MESNEICRIGIDPSINSTGICVSIERGEDNINYYYIISSKETRAMKNFSHPNIHIIYYNKHNTPTTATYAEKEQSKTLNISAICETISDIVDKYHPVEIMMEGVSYGSVGSAALVDLSGLNFSIRVTLQKLGYNIKILSPMEVKKFAVANGGANKDVMTNAWRMLDRNIKDVKGIKVDDIADAFFMAHFGH